MATTLRKVSSKQVIAIHSLMAQHCKTVDGFAVYEEGWDDARIMREITANNPEPDRPISDTSVTRLRVENFGRFKRQMIDDVNTTLLMARIDQLEADYRDLLDWTLRVAKFLQEKFPTQRERYTPPIGRPQSAPRMED
jgi:hypothetical protein